MVIPRLLLTFAAKSQYIVSYECERIRKHHQGTAEAFGREPTDAGRPADVGLNTLVAIERGEGNPQLSTLLTILDTLGLQMDICLKTLDYETV